MNEIINVTNQTPIEIALQIDGEGFTTKDLRHQRNYIHG